ncbi:MAG TPA: UDP-2,3-diacylglucosamine diphosphatase [bacterium]|nr:UDP-2,3-diacylglucosamine diphosphatase [bacterium]
MKSGYGSMRTLETVTVTETINHAFFVGDVHLDTRHSDREVAFCRFLDHIREQRPDHVYLLGDLFEFWFGYSKVMFSTHLRTIMKIARLTENGIPVTYLVGNHDFRPGPVFSDILGVRIEMDVIRIRLGSHQVYVAHGDEINFADWKYRMIRHLLRNPVTQTLFRFIVPPSAAWHIGRCTSDSSRKLNAERERPIPEPVFRSFIAREAERGIDTIIHGHNHDPGIRRITHEDRTVTLIDSGDWLGVQGHYVEFVDDTFRCETWPI